MKATLKVLAIVAALAATRAPAFAGDLSDALLAGAAAATLATDSGDDPLSQAVEAAGDVLDLD
jgi:hypothetical protein